MRSPHHPLLAFCAQHYARSCSTHPMGCMGLMVDVSADRLPKEGTVDVFLPPGKGEHGTLGDMHACSEGTTVPSLTASPLPASANPVTAGAMPWPTELGIPLGDEDMGLWG